MIEKAYIHPWDKEMSEKVLSNPVVTSFLDTVFKENLDAVNSYIYSVSGICMEKNHPVVQYLKEGVRMFGLSSIPPVYITRNYRYDVNCIGYEEPVITISHQLLERNNKEILRGRMIAAAASIGAGHHKLSFLIWIMENFGSVIPIPFATTAIRGILYEWYRAQFYTLDRAFFLAVRDAKLALKNILYGEMPFDMLENYKFGEHDTYLEQVKEFYKVTNIAEGISGISGIFQCEIWLPARYHELWKYCGEVERWT
ncbi:MAG: hypothetical protein IKW08_03810 [Roseburia sp.]|nr:hypothetical protein [Roseburia sp.]